MIDREKVIKAVEEAFDLVHSDFIGTDDFNETEWEQNKVDTLALLNEQEVKTGKWIEQIDYLGDTYYDCSVCNESWTTIDGTPWQNGMNYCPHCGSKMKLEQS